MTVGTGSQSIARREDAEDGASKRVTRLPPTTRVNGQRFIAPEYAAREDEEPLSTRTIKDIKNVAVTESLSASVGENPSETFWRTWVLARRGIRSSASTTTEYSPNCVWGPLADRRKKRKRRPSPRRILHSWGMMKTRCTNPKCLDYKDYGGRGIKICERWMKSFQDFVGQMGPAPAGMTLEEWT